MSIEYSQILTHIVGFLIALWILGKFAWKPILGVLDERRQKIADEFANIDNKKLEAEKLLADYEQRLKHIEDEARQRLNESVAEGQKIAAQIKADAQDEAKKIISRAKQDLEREVAQARSLLKADMVSMTLAATERLLHEKLDAGAHQKLINRFLDEVETAA